MTSKSLYNAERTIEDYFNKHWQKLGAEKAMKMKEIDDWEVNLIRRVKEHASKQRQQAQFQFDCQSRALENRRHAFLETLVCHGRNGNLDRIQQLLEECQALKFELISFEYPEKNIPFIRSISPKANSVESSINQTGVNLPPSGQICVNQNHTVPSPQVTLINVKHYNRDVGETPTVTTNMNNKNGERFHDINDDDSNIHKCPTCFMIFPPSMVNSERDRHVNEHFEST
ncbi:unnamed protein product [Adineta ricciae]|uniref:UBZ1-type domain-containing protein n=1 Tax=Adineta ricciae TaxID=249248 RepID=A0A813VD29_ADIRI|nr:unnamed protein product [Adineta ricciae]CAF1655751.1 unnamed protein product [Adineta ricciae]